ncbi:MAG: HAD family hydrolase [Bacteroidetes bacterium]|nr:HAD family hydrolase [Bacteroidota bacterium]
MSLGHYHINKNWSLFLDRDGVINHRIVDDYVKTLTEFKFIQGVPSAIAGLNKVFGRVFIVTNQQGIGKGLMTETDLKVVHEFMIKEITKVGGAIDQIYFCPELAESNHPDRKPQIGMAIRAKQDFPEIDFAKSIMVGDSISDMEFGINAGMINVLVAAEKSVEQKITKMAEVCVESLADFSQLLKN